RVGFGHQSFGNVTAQMSIPACFVMKGVENRIRALVFFDAVPGHGSGFLLCQLRTLLEERFHLSLLAGLGLQLDVERVLSHLLIPPYWFFSSLEEHIASTG